MIRFAILVVGIVAIAGLATWWLVADDSTPEPPRVEQTDEPTREPEPEETHTATAVPPSVIERHEIERRTETKDDDGSTQIVIPRDNPPSSSPPPEPPPEPPEPPPPILPIEIPEIPNPPEPPLPDIPLMP